MPIAVQIAVAWASFLAGFVWLLSRASKVPEQPSCYGMRVGPQQRAENDCMSCPVSVSCRRVAMREMAR